MISITKPQSVSSLLAGVEAAEPGGGVFPAPGLMVRLYTPRHETVSMAASLSWTLTGESSWSADLSSERKYISILHFIIMTTVLCSLRQSLVTGNL